MGYVYHGNYTRFFHISRTDFSRTDLLRKKVSYDGANLLRTTLIEYSSTRMHFDHQVCNKAGKLVNKGTSTVVMVNASNRKSIRMPSFMLDKIKA